MLLIVGLGNPGLQYRKTRHNIGFRVLDQFRKENNFPRFKMQKKTMAEISESMFGNQKVMLAKPQTYMNNSGKAIKLIFNFPRRTPCFQRKEGGLRDRQFSNNLVVVHDDLDLPLGIIKISQNRGSAGHKGVESIIKELGSQNFFRLRAGIKPISEARPQILPKELVLKKFSKNEEKILKPVIKKASQALNTLITQGPEKAMSEIN